MEFTKETLWDLRNEIVLNSLFLDDYSNSFGIDEHKVCDFFDGYMDDITDQYMEKHGLEKIDTSDLSDVWDEFDNADTLWNYYNSVENAFGVEESLKESEEEDDGAFARGQGSYLLPKEVTFKASEVALDTDDEDPEERLSDLLSDRYGYCHYGFKYEVKNNENGEPSEFRCYDIEWDTSESLKEGKLKDYKGYKYEKVTLGKEDGYVFDGIEVYKLYNEHGKVETECESLKELKEIVDNRIKLGYWAY